MTKHALSILSFIIVTFGVQESSHFIINKSHFDSIGFAREEPIMLLGFIVMIIQGVIISGSLAVLRSENVSIKDALKVSYSFGLFLVSYIALTEPAKYAVPSLFDWILIEGSAGIVQYGIYGLVLGFIHKRY